jgi:hypothetical protein
MFIIAQGQLYNATKTALIFCATTNIFSLILPDKTESRVWSAEYPETPQL